MWRADDDITTDLASGDPERIAAGIRDLEVRLDAFDEFSLPPLDLPSLLSAFHDGIPPETQLSLLRLLTHYESFAPPRSSEQQRDALLDLLLHGGDSRLAMEIALNLKGADDPSAAVTDALTALGRRPLATPRAVEGAQWFLSYLLAGEPAVRTATLSAVQQWPRDPGHKAAIDFIRPELTPTEAAELAP